MKNNNLNNIQFIIILILIEINKEKALKEVKYILLVLYLKKCLNAEVNN